jgi:hypothetical protein
MNPFIEDEHVDEYTLSLFADEALPPEEMAAVAEHVADCATCRAEVASMRQGMELVGREPAGYGAGAHMPSVWLSRYADGESPADEAALVKAHIATCARCRDEVEETRWFTSELRRAVARRRRPPSDPTRGLVTVAMLQARPQFPKGEGDPDILRMMREVLEQDDPEAPEPAPAVAPAGDDHRILRPKRPWWTAPVVALAVAAALAVVSLAPLCRGFPGLRACLGEQFRNAGMLQVAQLLLSPTPTTTPQPTLMVRVLEPSTRTPLPPTATATYTPRPTRNPENDLPTLRAHYSETRTAIWATPIYTWTPQPTWNATRVARFEATADYLDAHPEEGGGGGSDYGPPETVTPSPTPSPWRYPVAEWWKMRAATATERTRRIRYPYRIFVPFAGSVSELRFEILGMGAVDGAPDVKGEAAPTPPVHASAPPKESMLAAGNNLASADLGGFLLAVAGVAFVAGWRLRGRQGMSVAGGRSDDPGEPYPKAVTWSKLQDLIGCQRPDPGASMNGRNDHER